MKYYDLYSNNECLGQYRTRGDALSDASDLLDYIEGDHEFDADNPDVVSVLRYEDVEYIDTIYERTRVGDEKWKNTLKNK